MKQAAKLTQKKMASLLGTSSSAICASHSLSSSSSTPSISPICFKPGNWTISPNLNPYCFLNSKLLVKLNSQILVYREDLWRKAKRRNPNKAKEEQVSSPSLSCECSHRNQLHWTSTTSNFMIKFQTSLDFTKS